MSCTLISPATLNLTGSTGIYRNSTYCLELIFEDEGGPLDITDYVLDADIQDQSTLATVGTWTLSITDAVNGVATMSLTPAETLALPLGTHNWDLSLTSSVGTRYYWLKGTVDVYETVSRT